MKRRFDASSLTTLGSRALSKRVDRSSLLGLPLLSRLAPRRNGSYRSGQWKSTIEQVLSGVVIIIRGREGGIERVRNLLSWATAEGGPGLEFESPKGLGAKTLIQGAEFTPEAIESRMRGVVESRGPSVVLL